MHCLYRFSWADIWKCFLSISNTCGLRSLKGIPNVLMFIFLWINYFRENMYIYVAFSCNIANLRCYLYWFPSCCYYRHWWSLVIVLTGPSDHFVVAIHQAIFSRLKTNLLLILCTDVFILNAKVQCDQYFFLNFSIRSIINPVHFYPSDGLESGS